MKFLTKSNWKRLWPLLVLLAAALASVLTHWGMTQYYADWTYTDGVIQKIYQSRKNHGSYRIYYTYAVNGTVYTWETMSRGVNTNYAEGDAAEIWYDPDNPSRSFFGKPSPELYPILPFIITFPFLGARLFGALVRKNQRTVLR